MLSAKLQPSGFNVLKVLSPSISVKPSIPPALPVLPSWAAGPPVARLFDWPTGPAIMVVCRRKAGPHPGKGSLTPWGRKSDCGNSPVSTWKPAGQEITTGLLWKLITFCWSQQSESTKQWSDFEAIGFEIWSLFCWSAEKNWLHSVSRFLQGWVKSLGFEFPMWLISQWNQHSRG